MNAEAPCSCLSVYSHKKNDWIFADACFCPRRPCCCERDTWYDITGRIVFTNSKGLVGVGLPRKGSRTTPKTHITTLEGKLREGNFGWEDLYKDENWLLVEGTVVTMQVTDDTWPGGARQVTRTFKAPFARASREEDYRVAWAFFKPEKED